jgi:hypothetical protein
MKSLLPAFSDPAITKESMEMPTAKSAAAISAWTRLRLFIAGTDAYLPLCHRR